LIDHAAMKPSLLAKLEILVERREGETGSSWVAIGQAMPLSARRVSRRAVSERKGTAER
jgi:hypothetical protein